MNNLPPTSSDKSDRLKCYFSLLNDKGEGIWVDSKGLSMLPLFYKGVRVHINTEMQQLQKGQIVVFHRSDKFIAHRIVDYDTQSGLFTTKGDTLFYFDAPAKREEFLGLVDVIEKRGKSCKVKIDPEIAKLSNQLGKRLITTLHWLPGWLKFFYYFLFFIPGFIAIHLQKIIPR